MFDRLKIACMIAAMYVQQGVEHVKTSVYQYVFPIQQEIIVTPSLDMQNDQHCMHEEESCDDVAQSFDKKCILRIREAFFDDLQEALCFLSQDDLFGQHVLAHLEKACSFEDFPKLSLDRQYVEKIVDLMPLSVTSYEVQRLVLLIILTMAHLLPEDKQTIEQRYAILEHQ